MARLRSLAKSSLGARQQEEEKKVKKTEASQSRVSMPVKGPEEEAKVGRFRVERNERWLTLTSEKLHTIMQRVFLQVWN